MYQNQLQLCTLLLLFCHHLAPVLLEDTLQEQLSNLLRSSKTPDELRQLREEARGMFDHAFTKYMEYGFPQDEVRPISCVGHNSQGGMALTLLDALDSLAVMDRGSELREAVQWVASNIKFDIDARVHVFELNIRVVGGLLSTHVLLERTPHLVPSYDGALLRMAVDLADRLVPAFSTETGIPLSWINLSKGVIRDETRVTCTACAGTLLLEFGLLSQLTGNATYYQLAKHAAHQLFIRRSSLGLVGNTIHCDRGTWERRDSGIGAGIDSYYEYLLKGYLLTGDLDLLRMFSTLYSSVMHFMRCPPTLAPAGWLVDVHMDSGKLVRSWVSSLGAFWPGLQALIGQVEEGRWLLRNWTQAWGRFGWIPEQFDLSVSQRHPIETGYPLRPEIMESTYLLYSASEDPSYFDVGARLHNTILEKNKQACGFASVGDVATGRMEDTMESFFLSETSKYLFMLFSNVTSLPDYVIFSTEGHLFFPLPSQEAAEQSPALMEGLPQHCKFLCSTDRGSDTLEQVHAAFPLIGVHPDDSQLIRYRRCMACALVSQEVMAVAAKFTPAPTQHQVVNKHESVEYHPEQQSQPAVQQEGQCQATTTNQQEQQRQVFSQLMCALKIEEGNKWTCPEFRALEVGSVDPTKLVAGIVVLQLVGTGAPASASNTFGRRLLVSANSQAMKIPVRGIGAVFGPQFGVPSMCAESGDSSEEGSEDEYLDEGEEQDGSIGEDSCSCEGGGGAANGDECSTQGGDEGLEVVVDQKTLKDGTPVLCNFTAAAGVAIPWDACQPLTNSAAVRGRIVMASRGTCLFIDKARHVEEAGGVGLIVVNSIPEEGLMAMSGDGQGTVSDIPAVMVKHEAGLALKELASASPPVLLSIAPADWTCDVDDADCTQDATAIETHVELLIPQATQSWLVQQGHSNTKILQSFTSLLANQELLQHLSASAAMKGTTTQPEANQQAASSEDSTQDQADVDDVYYDDDD